MGRRGGRRGPADPQAILAANALRRGQQAQAERQAKNTPEKWGVCAQILQLPTSADVDVTRGARGAVIAANRSDPFDLLHSAVTVDDAGGERRGLTDEQHRASRRLFRDWCLRAGVRDKERQALERVDGGRADPSALVTDAMVDAGRRISQVLKGDPRNGISGVGPVAHKLLEALISPMVDEGRIIAWRGVVERVTGEKDRNAQGAMVRQACQALHLVYEELDAHRRRMRDAAQNDEAAA